jgi:hypothetical protein
VVDGGGVQGSVQLDTELFYAATPDPQIYEFVSGELRQYLGGSLLAKDVTFSPINFVGALNDMTLTGAYNHTAVSSYAVTIDGTGTPDTFKWRNYDVGSVWTENVPIVAGNIELERGITIAFGATTGHTITNSWTFTAYPLNVATFLGGALALNDLTPGDAFTGSDPKQYVVKVEPIKTAPILSFASNGPGSTLVTTDGVHGLANPTDYVHILNSNAYDETVLYPTVYINATQFAIYANYVAETITNQYFEKRNTFTWSDDGVVSWAATNVAMATSPVTLSDDFTVQFGSVLGHTVDNMWVIPKFISYEAQNEIIAESDYIRFADVTDYTGSVDDASSLSDFYKANRWIFVHSTGTGIPDKYVMHVYDPSTAAGLPFTGELNYPDRFRTSTFIGDFASLDAAERHAEHVLNIINAFTKEYNALLNSNFSTYEGTYPGNEAKYTFPQY